MSTAQQNTYQAGMCNINPTEVAYRRKAGWAGVFITCAIAVPLLLSDVSRWWRSLLILPIFLSAVGFLQAKHHFCVSYASKGLQNAAGTAMNTAARVSAQDQQRDRRKAKLIYIQAGAMSALATALIVALPYY